MTGNPYSLADRLRELLLTEFLEGIIYDPYPVDIFPEVTPEELERINGILQDKLGFPIDRLTAHIGRRLREPLRDTARVILDFYKKPEEGNAGTTEQG